MIHNSATFLVLFKPFLSMTFSSLSFLSEFLLDAPVSRGSFLLYFLLLLFSFLYFLSPGAVQSEKMERAYTTWPHRTRQATRAPHKYKLFPMYSDSHWIHSVEAIRRRPANVGLDQYSLLKSFSQAHFTKRGFSCSLPSLWTNIAWKNAPAFIILGEESIFFLSFESCRQAPTSCCPEGDRRWCSFVIFASMWIQQAANITAHTFAR